MARDNRDDLRPFLERFIADASFLERYPYYAHVIAQLEPVHDPSVPLMGVSLHAASGRGARYYLHVNVAEVAREPQYLRGLLLHEVHHIALGHLVHPKFFAVQHRDLMQIAQETSANEYIEEPLPAPIRYQHFERLGFRAGQSTLDRYELLCKARAEGKQPELSRDTTYVDEHAWLEQSAPHPLGLSETRKLLEQADEREQARERVETERPKLAGKTPEQLLLSLGGAREPRVSIDWRDALRMFVAEVRAPLHTWSRPSRRFPARIGELPGRSYRLRPSLRPRLAVVLDTSLSMTFDELSEIARQLRAMSELAQLTVVECDAQIVRTYPFRGEICSVEGRGGTDLRPAFDPSFLTAIKAEGIIYFTDGEGAVPDRAPAIPVLWMLTKPSEFPCTFGARARLDLGQTARRGRR